MARFDVYKNKAAASPPLLLQIQSELHDQLAGRVMVPLLPKRQVRGRSLDRLMPDFEIDGKKYTMITPELASIPKQFLGQKVASLEHRRYEIGAAVDFLMQGF